MYAGHSRGARAKCSRICGWICPAQSDVTRQIRQSIFAFFTLLSARLDEDNEALSVLALLDDRSLQDLGVTRTVYMRAASNLRLSG
jgi:uncharacterized protein YjiS (DUF1127 family)